MTRDQIAAAMAAFHTMPDEAGIPIPVAGALMHRSDVSIWRDIAARRLESFKIGRSRRVVAGSIRRVIVGRTS